MSTNCRLERPMAVIMPAAEMAAAAWAGLPSGSERRSSPTQPLQARPASLGPQISGEMAQG